MQEYRNLVDWKGLELLSAEKRCKASVKKFERSPTVLAEWIELKETLAKFKLEKAMRRQMTRGLMIRHQKLNTSGNQTQAQWSFAAEAWREATYGILSLTC